jgi:hypothetical protein
MKFAVYDASQLPLGERRKKTEAMRVLSERESELSIKYCHHEAEIGALYDELSTSNDPNDEDDRLASYCTRKYLIENPFIDNHVYNLTLDVNGIDLSTINCDEIIQSFKEEVEKSLIDGMKDENSDVSHDEMECVLKKYRDGNYTEHFMKVAVIGNSDLDNEQKIKERRNFIKFISVIVDQLRNCF